MNFFTFELMLRCLELCLAWTKFMQLVFFNKKHKYRNIPTSTDRRSPTVTSHLTSLPRQKNTIGNYFPKKKKGTKSEKGGITHGDRLQNQKKRMTRYRMCFPPFFFSLCWRNFALKKIPFLPLHSMLPHLFPSRTVRAFVIWLR